MPAAQQGVPMDWLTTSTLLQDLRYERDEAWQSLVDRFRGPIVRFARRAGHPPADAEDVAQQTLLTFVQRYREGRYDPARGRLSRWLFGIAWHQLLRDRRARAREPVNIPTVTGDTSFWSALPDESAATTIWDHEWERAMMATCLDRVRREVEPATLRAFELVVLEARRPADAAAELGVPVEHVYSAKHRMLTRLRALREQLEGID